MHGRRWFGIRSAATLLAMSLFVVCTPASGSAAADEARVVGENWVDDRTLDLTISSPALGTEAPVRLLLPEGWSKDSTKKWPVMYLLHGCCDEADYKAWTEYTDVERFMADKDVITVLPSDGPAGFYTQWWNFGQESVDWESFHVEEVRQILENDYGAGTTRAVAGISIGGYGSMAYAFRHPGMFRAAGSFSGLVHTLGIGVPQVITGILIREGENPLALWGDWRLQYGIWSERNPYDHAEELRGTELWISSGNGHRGPFDPPDMGYDALEGAALPVSEALVNKLKEVGVPVTADFYGNGSHDWPYWERELERAWPMFSSALGVG